MESFKFFKNCLFGRLASIGFRSGSNIAWRRHKDTVVVVEIQKDRKVGLGGESRFTINVGISINLLRPANSVVPPPEKCHWRQRLGRMLPQQADTWWVVGDIQTAQLLCDEIGDGLLRIALPKVDEMASSDALLHAWHQDQGQGLTEYERRVCLIRLLIALDRREEAAAALQAFEQASIGRSWAGSAAVDLKEFRKELA